jgi:hypothetical protein
METAGSNLKSSFRSNFFSSMTPGLISTSESLESSTGGACFSDSEAMVVVIVEERDDWRVMDLGDERSTRRYYFKQAHQNRQLSSNDARSWLSNLSSPRRHCQG